MMTQIVLDYKFEHRLCLATTMTTYTKYFFKFDQKQSIWNAYRIASKIFFFF